MDEVRVAWLKTSRAVRFLAVGAFASSAQPACAAGSVVGPNGEYRENVTDIAVKVLGGHVAMERSWLGGRWYFNPAWADLKFTYDALDGSVKGIDRAGVIYARSESGVFNFEQRFFIRKTSGGWRWNDTFGNKVDFDPTGRISAYFDRNDIQVSFTRDSEGRISQVKDHNGAVALSYTYTDGNLSSISDAHGRSVQYHWTGGNLTSVTDVLQHDWSYSYDGNGQITGGADPNSHSWSLTYVRSFPAPAIGGVATASSTGTGGRDFRVSRVATLTDERSKITRFEYDYDRVKRLWSVVRISPSQRRYSATYNADARVVRREEGSAVVFSRRFDGELVELISDERGKTTRVERDGRRNVTRVVHPDGSTELFKYDAQFSVPVEIVDGRGTVTRAKVDAHGNYTQIVQALGEPEERTATLTWNGLGQIEQLSTKGLDMATEAVAHFGYDASGNVEMVTDPESRVDHYTYNAMGLPLTRVDALNKSWRWNYDDAGRLLSTTDPLGHGESYGYDAVGNLTAVSDALGRRVMTLSYDAQNRVSRWVDGLSALDVATVVEYDDDGRVVSVLEANAQSQQRQYDARGRLWKVTDGLGDTIEVVYGTDLDALSGLVAAVKFPTFTREYKYDERDRVVESIDVLSAGVRRVTRRDYDAAGNEVSAIDAGGRVTQRSFDRLNRVIEVVDALQGKVQYTYGPRNNLLTLTNAIGQVQRFEYDRSDRVLAEYRPLGEKTRFSYDAVGRLEWRTDAKGQRGQRAYDDAGRLSTIGYFQAGADVASRTVEFSYDDNDRLIGYRDGVTSATYGYDLLGRKQLETIDYGAFSITHEFDYDPRGQLSHYTDVSGERFEFAYNAAGQLQRVSIPGQGDMLWGNFQWLRARQMTYPGGTTLDLGFDEYLRPTSVKATSQSAGVFADVGYDYDASGSLVGKRTEHGNYVFGYDAVGRLVSADYPNGAGNDHVDSSFAVGTFPFSDDVFSYDLNGNRIRDEARSASTQWRYNGNGELIDNGVATFSYDDNGSLIQRSDTQGNPQFKYLYDTEGRLTELRDGADVLIASYYYDPFGRRLWKTLAAGKGGNPSGSPATVYLDYTDGGYAAELVLAGAHQVGNPDQNAAGAVVGGLSVEVGMSTPTISRRFLFDPKGFWASAPLALWHRREGNASGWRYPVADQLGSIDYLVDGSSAVVHSARRSAFGETDWIGEEQALGLGGQFASSELGANYNFLRDYDPVIGRYLSADPIGLAGGANPYAYVAGNPLVNLDPEGTELVAAVVEAGVDLSAQLLVNGGNWNCVNWWQVGGSAALGFVFPGAGSYFGFGRAGKTGIDWATNAKRLGLPYRPPLEADLYNITDNMLQFFGLGFTGKFLAYTTPGNEVGFLKGTAASKEIYAYMAGQGARAGAHAAISDDCCE